jgi:4-aminobutyrate aminotransferase-like enzyme/Ser/Thr protein kinase RdoA (MazF antagonist)
MLDHTPAFSVADAERIAWECYGQRGVATRLPSERDQNFLIEPHDGERLVLKIANALDHRALLEAQQHVLAVLEQRGLSSPRVICSTSGEALVEVSDVSGKRHLSWAISWLPGMLLAGIRHRSPTLLEALGAAIGQLSAALEAVEHPALERDFYWDLARAPERIAAARPHIVDETLGAAIDKTLALTRRYVVSRARELPRSVIHNDLNDHNILISGADQTGSLTNFDRVTGIVDFGDMLYGWRVADLAIAGAYAMLDSDDPLATLAALVRGAATTIHFEDAELDVLFALSCLRLALSAAIAIEQQQARPENDYLGVSQAAIRRTLPRLVDVPYELATAVVREAAGREPIPRAERLRRWLATKTPYFAPVIDVDLRNEPCVVLNLSVSSPLVSGDPTENAEPKLTRRVKEAIREADVRVAIGRYDEARLLYTAPFFGGPTASKERRTIHIGLDLFADAGTAVYAPLTGRVAALADNATEQDYGPVIMLRHESDEGDTFFTLYGHLARTSLDGLAVEQRIERGERFATLGAPNENGGWTPHLHLQVITDLLGFGTDFPGVSPASQRAVWRSLSPDPNLIVGVPAERFPRPPADRLTTIAERRRRFAHNVTLSYDAPLKVERGWMQYLYDETGRQYLDAYNNVPHVGHCHPRVVRAGQSQMAILNTNTRYPSDVANEYAARLVATLPAPLNDGVVFLVNSASEANELALRLARAYTKQRDTIVLEAAYHGNTTSLIDISPYKHGGPGGNGTPSWVHVARLADDYRGPFKRSDPDAGRKYARSVGEVVELLHAQGRGVACFIAESCPSVGGQIVFPPGYLAAAYAFVRAAGGICIADEVQTGLGRIGTHFWAFEAQGVRPDAIVMGKPLGNGHPLAAVVVRREIADAFDNGMEYFSTFGGNQVACAIGLTVLDVVREEALQARASCVGERMLRGLRPFVGRHALVGDVRGSGLFLGVELVRDRESLEPADREASYVVNRMREEGILLGTDGPFHNVLKIRPPMPFADADADRLVETLDGILSEASAAG